MSKDKKPTVKVDKSNVKNVDLTKPTMSTLLHMEFDLPDVSIGGFETQKQFEKWIHALQNHFEKLYGEYSKTLDKNNRILDMMFTYLNKHPELFAEAHDEVSRDMMKFFFEKHIDKCQAIVDKISQIEKDLDLPIH